MNGLGSSIANLIKQITDAINKLKDIAPTLEKMKKETKIKQEGNYVYVTNSYFDITIFMKNKEAEDIIAFLVNLLS